MPRSKHLNRYPSAFADFIVQGLNPKLGEEGLRIPLGCPKKAASTRHLLYAFMKAFEAATPLEQGLFPQLDKWMFGKIYITIEGDVLVIKSREHHWACVAMKKALEDLKVRGIVEEAAPDHELDAMAKRLAEARQNTPYGDMSD